MRIAKCENGHYFYPEQSAECPKCGAYDYQFIGDKPEKKERVSDEEKKSEKNQPDKKLNKKKTKRRTEKKLGKRRLWKKAQNKTSEESIEDRSTMEGGATKGDEPTKKDETVINPPLSPEPSVPPCPSSVTLYFGRNTAVGSAPVTGWLVCVAGKDIGKSYVLKEGKNTVGDAPRSDVVIDSDGNNTTVVYDPKNRNFYVIPESGEGIYLNGRLLRPDTGIAAELKNRDAFLIGSSRFVFVNFCSKEFTWD